MKALRKETEVSKKYLKRVTNKNKRKSGTARSAKRMKRNVALADEHYGDLEKEADLDSEVFNEKKNELLSTLNDSVCQRHEIAIKTIGQGANEEWHKQRKIRLTASFFGQVCKLKQTTSCKNIVKQLLIVHLKATVQQNMGMKMNP